MQPTINFTPVEDYLKKIKNIGFLIRLLIVTTREQQLTGLIQLERLHREFLLFEDQLRKSAKPWSSEQFHKRQQALLRELAHVANGIAKKLPGSSEFFILDPQLSNEHILAKWQALSPFQKFFYALKDPEIMSTPSVAAETKSPQTFIPKMEQKVKTFFKYVIKSWRPNTILRVSAKK